VVAGGPRLVLDAEAVVFRVLEAGDDLLAEQDRAHLPEVVEDAVAERGLVEVGDAARPAGADAPADDTLDHARVALSPDDHPLLEEQERLADLAWPREPRQLAVALDEDERRAHVAAVGALRLGAVGRPHEG